MNLKFEFLKIHYNQSADITFQEASIVISVTFSFDTLEDIIPLLQNFLTDRDERPRYSNKKWRFPLRISSVNVTKSSDFCGFGHIYWRNPQWKTSFFVQCAHQDISLLKQCLLVHKRFFVSLTNQWPFLHHNTILIQFFNCCIIKSAGKL